MIGEEDGCVGGRGREERGRERNGEERERRKVKSSYLLAEEQPRRLSELLKDREVDEDDDLLAVSTLDLVRGWKEERREGTDDLLEVAKEESVSGARLAPRVIECKRAQEDEGRRTRNEAETRNEDVQGRRRLCRPWY